MTAVERRADFRRAGLKEKEGAPRQIRTAREGWLLTSSSDRRHRDGDYQIITRYVRVHTILGRSQLLTTLFYIFFLKKNGRKARASGRFSFPVRICGCAGPRKKNAQSEEVGWCRWMEGTKQRGRGREDRARRQGNETYREGGGGGCHCGQRRKSDNNEIIKLFCKISARMRVITFDRER